MKKLSVESLCVQGGYVPGNGDTRIAPIYQSTTYKYDNSDGVADLFNLTKEGHIYSRISNPTLEVLDKKIVEIISDLDQTLERSQKCL